MGQSGCATENARAHPDVHPVPAHEHGARLRVGAHRLAEALRELELARGVLDDRDDERVVEPVVLDPLRGERAFAFVCR